MLTCSRLIGRRRKNADFIARNERENMPRHLRCPFMKRDVWFVFEFIFAWPTSADTHTSNTIRAKNNESKSIFDQCENTNCLTAWTCIGFFFHSVASNQLMLFMYIISTRLINISTLCSHWHYSSFYKVRFGSLYFTFRFFLPFGFVKSIQHRSHT